MSFRLWEIAKDPKKREALKWLGGGVAAVQFAIWTIFTFLVEHKDVPIQKLLTDQLGQKDSQIATLTKLLLKENPAAGPGAQQAVGAAFGSIFKGAAEGDTRLQQALDLLKENKITEASQLLRAVAVATAN